MESVSVIIPAYNSAATIEKCVESILCQTVSDFLIYIVDDCSTDNTWEVLSNLINRDSRIRVFRNEKNSGPSVSRNKAIGASNGEWLCFIDSDDYVCPDFLEKMLNASDNSEIVIGSFVSVDENGHILKRYNVTSDYQSSDIETALDKAYNGKADLDFIYNLCWNKLYKRKLFTNVEFPEGRLQEDAFVMPYLIYAANGRVNIAPDALYYYVDNSQSVSHMGQKGKADLMRRIDLIYLYECHIKLYQEHKNNLYKRSRANLINNIISIFRLHYSAYASVYECEFKRLKKIFCSHYLSSVKENNEYLSKPLLLTLSVFCIWPKLYLKIF